MWLSVRQVFGANTADPSLNRCAHPIQEEAVGMAGRKRKRRLARLVHATRIGQHQHHQRLPLLGNAAVGSPLGMLGQERQGVGRIPA